MGHVLGIDMVCTCVFILRKVLKVLLLYNHDADIPSTGGAPERSPLGLLFVRFFVSLSLCSALPHALWLILIRPNPPEFIWYHRRRHRRRHHHRHRHRVGVG